MTLQALFFVAFTIAVYYGALRLQRRVKSVFLNPVLVTVTLTILLLTATGITYEDYNAGGHYISFWLKPAIVALGLPLYRHLETVRRQFLPIFMSQLAGSTVGILSVVWIAYWLGADREVVLSLAPKSVTMPIAIEITRMVGGIPALTSAVVISVGIFGAMVGLRCLDYFGAWPNEARGISMGTAAHGIGTAHMFTIDSAQGAFATLGLILNGIFTSLLTAPLLSLCGFI